MDTVLKRYKENQVHKEQCIFFALCSDEDRMVITGERKTDLEELERLHHLMLNLGLENLHTHFLMKYMEFFEELSDQIEMNSMKNLNDVKKKVEKVALWNKEFLDQLPTEKIKHFIKEAFL